MISRIQKAFIHRYHRVRNLFPVWYYLLNRARRRSWKHLREQYPLTQLEQKVVTSLEHAGIAVVHIDELLPHQGILEALQAHTKKLRERWETDTTFRDALVAQKEHAPKGADETFLTPLYGGGWVTPELRLDDPVIRFCLHDRLIAIAGNYLGVTPQLSTFSLASTVVVPPDASQKYSQRWHRDPEDKKTLKIFLYLNDVLDEGTGPFQYIRNSTYGHTYGRLFPQVPPHGSYPAKEDVERLIPTKDIITCLGRAGTLVFADTSGLHRGGYSTTNVREMVTVGFATAALRIPLTFTKPANLDERLLPPLGRAVLASPYVT